MRIASLLPAATEWIAAFGAGDELVARSHECNHPPEITDLPVVTSTSIDVSSSSADIDQAVWQQVQEALNVYHVDLEGLNEFQPDLIVTQAQCDVCAVTERQLQEGLAAAGHEATELLSLSPMTFKEVLDGALRLSRKIGRSGAAMQVLAEFETSLRRLKHRIDISTEDTPRVLCIEWMDPLMTAGHWMPDCVEHAGGKPVLSTAGEHSEYVAWDAICNADPDVICVMPCGFDLDQLRANVGELTSRPGWKQLKAVQTGRVYFFDGDAYFNRPGPRLYRSIELLAYALHPTVHFPDTPVPKSTEMARLQAPESG